MKNIKIILFSLFLYITNACSMEKRTINYHDPLDKSTLYKEFIIERSKLLLELEEIWFNKKEKVDEVLGHKNLFEKLKEITTHDKKYYSMFISKKFKHSIIERNRQALLDKIK